MRNPTGPIRRARAAAAVLAVVGAGLLGSTAAHAAAPSIVATPSSVTDLQTISVRGNAGGPNAPDLYVAVCETTPTASNCDQSLSGFGTATAHILQVSPNQSTGAWGPLRFHVRQTLKTGHTPAGFHCTTTCVIGTTNSANPADHAWDSTTALTFVTPSASSTATATHTPGSTASSTPPTPAATHTGATARSTARATAPNSASPSASTARTTTAAVVSVDPTSTTGGASGDASSGAALAATGGSTLVPLLVGAAIAVLLAGLTLRVAAGRRGRRS